MIYSFRLILIALPGCWCSDELICVDYKHSIMIFRFRWTHCTKNRGLFLRSRNAKLHMSIVHCWLIDLRQGIDDVDVTRYPHNCGKPLSIFPHGGLSYLLSYLSIVIVIDDASLFRK